MQCNSRCDYGSPDIREAEDRLECAKAAFLKKYRPEGGKWI